MIRKTLLLTAICSIFFPALLEARVIIAPPRPAPPPGDGWAWVPPTYRTEWTRVWQEPAYQTIQERVWLPDEWGWRTVRYFEGGQWIERQEWVIVRPGHWSLVEGRVEIRPGGWVWRQQRIMVTPGHWEWVGPGPHPRPVPLPEPRPPFTPFPRPAELAPFSPLWEWPEEKK